jgi:ABC-type polysaccharide/polyol phosphate export permease
MECIALNLRLCEGVASFSLKLIVLTRFEILLVELFVISFFFSHFSGFEMGIHMIYFTFALFMFFFFCWNIALFMLRVSKCLGA